MKFDAKSWMVGAGVGLLPSVALAHPEHHESASFAQGLMHPLSGLDHVLAMLLIGAIAAQLGGRALWAIPLAFILAMSAFGAIAAAGVDAPFVEIGIAVSVIALGAAIMVARRLPGLIALGAAVVFGCFHGQAHGLEMRGEPNALVYGAGFVIAAVLLHAIGAALMRGASALESRTATRATRLAGAAAMAAGFVFLASAF